MSKNKIKEIEQKYDMWADDFNLTPQDIEWLIEQAKRAQDYKAAYEIADMLARNTIEKANELDQQNKRYREALEFYSDRNNYLPEHLDPETDEKWSKIDYDEGFNARKTLEKECTNGRYRQTNFR